MSDASQLWQRALQEQIRPAVNALTYKTWFRDLQARWLDDGQMQILVPDDMTLSQITPYKRLIDEALGLIAGRVFDCRFDIRAKVRPFNLDTLTTVQNNSSFNTDYTFERFIVGESNRFAYAACVAIAGMRDNSYNPLFLYGGSGLGKTHLMQAIGNEVLRSHPDKKVVYVQTERFVNEFIECIAKKNFDSFRNRYRQADLLLIDDIQFIEGKERMQEEFFHTFNALYEAGKHIVLTCDKPPQSLATLEDRLKTRMGSGIICDITPPDYETRMAILQQLMAKKRLILDQDVLDFVARNITSNIRELEGAFKTIDAYSRLGKVLDVEQVRLALKDMLQPGNEQIIDIDLIQDIVSRYYKLNPNDLLSNKRSQNIAVPRQLAMYLCRQLTDLTYEQIGEHFRRHHATAIHACSRIEEDLKQDLQLQNDYQEVLKRIQP